jgi:hypothetical protein
MKVTGFTFIRNAVKYDFPITEAITSILPICDEFVVAVGSSEDATRSLIEAIGSPKIRIIDTVWDDSLREGGKVLAAETDKAFKAISADTDWCFYIQGDEVVHEKYLNNIKVAMELYKDDPKVDGLLFKYLHFYGSYNHVGTDPSLYKHEIRIVRNDKSIFSYRDAQGFRKGNNEKLCVKPIHAYIYHYGRVKEPYNMQRKHEEFGRLWNTDEWLEKNIQKAEHFDYSGQKEPVGLFAGTHPAVMEKRIEQKNWDFEPNMSAVKFTLKQKLKIFLEEKVGLNLSYTNYKII